MEGDLLCHRMVVTIFRWRCPVVHSIQDNAKLLGPSHFSKPFQQSLLRRKCRLQNVDLQAFVNKYCLSKCSLQRRSKRGLNHIWSNWKHNTLIVEWVACPDVSKCKNSFKLAEYDTVPNEVRTIVEIRDWRYAFFKQQNSATAINWILAPAFNVWKCYYFTTHFKLIKCQYISIC